MRMFFSLLHLSILSVGVQLHRNVFRWVYVFFYDIGTCDFTISTSGVVVVVVRHDSTDLLRMSQHIWEEVRFSPVVPVYVVHRRHIIHSILVARHGHILRRKAQQIEKFHCGAVPCAFRVDDNACHSS